MLIYFKPSKQMDKTFLSYGCCKSPKHLKTTTATKTTFFEIQVPFGKFSIKIYTGTVKTINISFYSKNWNVLRMQQIFFLNKLKLATCFRKKWNNTSLFTLRFLCVFCLFVFRSLDKSSDNFIHCSSFAWITILSTLYLAMSHFSFKCQLVYFLLQPCH